MASVSCLRGRRIGRSCRSFDCQRGVHPAVVELHGDGMCSCTELLQSIRADRNDRAPGFCGNSDRASVDQRFYVMAEAAGVILAALYGNRDAAGASLFKTGRFGLSGSSDRRSEEISTV